MVPSKKVSYEGALLLKMKTLKFIFTPDCGSAKSGCMYSCNTLIDNLTN